MRSGNAFFGKSRRLISFKDQTPVSASVSVIVVFAYVCFFFSLEYFSVGVIVDDHRLPVYVACRIVQTCQRTERGVCLISLSSNYNPVCCVIACHCEGSWRELMEKKQSYLSYSKTVVVHRFTPTFCVVFTYISMWVIIPEARGWPGQFTAFYLKQHFPTVQKQLLF